MTLMLPRLIENYHHRFNELTWSQLNSMTPSSTELQQNQFTWAYSDWSDPRKNRNESHQKIIASSAVNRSCFVCTDTKSERRQGWINIKKQEQTGSSSSDLVEQLRFLASFLQQGPNRSEWGGRRPSTLKMAGGPMLGAVRETLTEKWKQRQRTRGRNDGVYTGSAITMFQSNQLNMWGAVAKVKPFHSPQFMWMLVIPAGESSSPNSLTDSLSAAWAECYAKTGSPRSRWCSLAFLGPFRDLHPTPC